ncbi:hypothetical protein HHK36_001406 [Tetracentron sinense]|uniref:RING-CH-type domain-containing protein n=1 Tax=Tetracentron sinense TaxID=13715 RepID=A0A834ZY31_TETSI|nr:hypothetical protein HHK36_001406 [Tetracentron sinense]
MLPDRVCLEEAEEALIELGCRCRGGLAKAHQSCIDTWFRTRGSNKCEICQQVAVNVPPPEPLPNVAPWGTYAKLRRHGQIIGSGGWTQPLGQLVLYKNVKGYGCFSPLWVALSILIGGLLLDVLISISLGVSALPVNIIIGVLVVLGLGTALRLALECCQEWSLRRVVQRVDTNVNLAYHPAV